MALNDLHLRPANDKKLFSCDQKHDTGISRPVAGALTLSNEESTCESTER